MSGTGHEGRGVVVTGAASGIGRATALRFAREGAKVLVADLDRAGAEATAKEVEAAGGVALAVVGDLSEQQVVDTVVERALESFGRLDVLVNNAGIMDRMSALGETDDAEWERVLRINLTAPFLLTRAVLPHMLAAQRGSIVFTCSEAGLRGGAAGAAYTASKHGIVGLVKNLAVMYRGQGIRANAVAPGPTATGIQVDAGPDAHGPGIVGGLIGANIGRLGSAEEQAAAIVFLASDAASFVNGAVLPVDDGWAAV
ncbi:SDR family NAD(P)-dependent oxidoreductase [Marinitenerispora sediminis]|uniref:3-ketoacyl-ACP reductase n=1 Tax=Marinitenerispora sediminis TaxID=1931232 RepID=A0A368T2F9_9ACTN|nr:SDR family NAD(P)-dependent oxidoreductase [Marinitenerispora sediminis]RCV48789.1 3-ketoacyl-ACP reductase [Marinitenerispora sediminis]RCV50721.1 3-ketoacyl-ACP reductase [Marinitenerispora sediminis]RCV55627.1 3-ketoacyl-ACP reductase [Marinitenerispora sediminis]